MEEPQRYLFIQNNRIVKSKVLDSFSYKKEIRSGNYQAIIPASETDIVNHDIELSHYYYDQDFAKLRKKKVLKPSVSKTIIDDETMELTDITIESDEPIELHACYYDGVECNELTFIKEPENGIIHFQVQSQIVGTITIQCVSLKIRFEEPIVIEVV